MITKTERRAALKRTKAFRAEFAAKPEHAINLASWYLADGFKVAVGYKHCGSVGCVGGYATHSPLMKVYLKTLHNTKYDNEVLSDSDIEERLFDFFGLTHAQAVKRALFASGLRKDTSKTDKDEGLERLDKLIKFHKKALEA